MRGKRLKLSSLRFLPTLMPCSHCGEWKDERIQWRRADCPALLLPTDIWVSESQGQCWFFYCSDCKAENTSLRGVYINADGHTSTDSESEREGEPPTPAAE